MTIPRGIAAHAGRVADMVRDMFPFMRARLSLDEQTLAVLLRGNTGFYNALKNVIEARITGRARVPEPSDPIACKSMIARDRELQWLLSRLSAIKNLPAETAQEGEQPS